MSGSGGGLQRVWLPVDLLPRDLIRLITALNHVQYLRVHIKGFFSPSYFR